MRGMLEIYGAPQSPNERARLRYNHDGPESPNEGGVFKMHGEPKSPYEGRA